MFYERIKELRLSNKMTQVEFAHKISTSKQSVSNWESGYATPTLDMFQKICEMFHVSADYLLGLEPQNYLDVQHPARSDGSLRNARIVTNLNLSDVLGFHLTQNQPGVAVYRGVINAEVIAGDDILITGNHQFRHHLEDIHQCLLSRQFHSLGINHRPVCLHLYDGLITFREHRIR